MSIFLLPQCGPANWEKSVCFCTMIRTKPSHGRKYSSLLLCTRLTMCPQGSNATIREGWPSKKKKPNTTAPFFQFFLLQTAIMGISHTLAPIDATKSQTPNAIATAKDIRRKCTKTAVSRGYVKTCLGRRKEQMSRKNPRLSTTAGSTSGGRKDEMLISKTKAFFITFPSPAAERGSHLPTATRLRPPRLPPVLACGAG